MVSTSVMRLPTMSESPLFCRVRRKSHTGLNVACGVLNSREDRCLRARAQVMHQQRCVAPPGCPTAASAAHARCRAANTQWSLGVGIAGIT